MTARFASLAVVVGKMGGAAIANSERADVLFATGRKVMV